MKMADKILTYYFLKNLVIAIDFGENIFSSRHGLKFFQLANIVNFFEKNDVKLCIKLCAAGIFGCRI